MGGQRDRGQDPRSLIIEFARTDDGGDPFAFRFESQEYLVRGPGGSYREITVPWRGPLWDELSAMRSSPELCQRLGDRLRGLLEAAEWDRIEDALRSATAEAPLVLTIRSAAAELFALPWGLVTLESDGRHVAELRHVLVRHEWSGAEPPPPASDAAPRILVAWSAAGGAVPSAEHIDAIARACEQRGISFDRASDVVDHASPRRLAEALDDPTRPVTALHMLCHGEAAEGGAGLLLDVDDEAAAAGRSKLVDAGALRRLLGRHAADLRLVVIAACASGSPSQRASHLGSVAQALHRVGVAAVVASRTALSIDGSIALTRDLYRGLLVRSMSLEAAMMRTRARLVHAAGLDWAALQLYSSSDAGTDTRPFALRPYRGLLSFDENHQPYFFGREREIAALRDWAEGAAAGARGLHFIVGGSGSGKLSLLRAGLIPALRGRRERRWRVAVIRPADDRERPQSALSAAFIRAMGDALAVDSRASVDALLATLRGASEQGESLLLIVSRFEEVFTHLPSRAQATAYVRALAELAACPGVAVAATLRTDFIPRCAELRLADGRRLDELLYDDHERMLLGPPGAAALRDLIVGPARAVGIRLEPALVERLVADIEGEAAALPLLQHCLDLLWTKRRGRLLTLDSYERLGRIAGALARSADAVLAGLSPEEREQARCLLVALVDLGENLAPRGRRRLDRELLRPLVDSAQADFDRVVDALSEGRLLVTGATMADDGRRPRGRRSRAPTVWLDLAHEALVDRWPTLRAWLDEDRVDLLALRRVVSAYQEWRAHLGERRARYDYLLVGDRLHEALRLTRRRPGLVPGPVLVFIYESEELVAASRMRGLVERLLPTYAAPLALAFLPGLAALERAPQIELATIPALLAGAVVFAATLRAWGWAVLVQERVLSPAPVDSAIHAWILSALAGLAAWGAAGGPDLTDIFWLIPWSGWISLALAALALGRALLITRVVHHEPGARRWGRGQLVVALACVALNLGALATAHPWALWLAALAVDVAGAALLRPRLEPRGDDDGRTTAGKIDDAAVVAAVIVILVGLPATAADGLALLSLATMIGPSLGLLSALVLESRRPHTRDDHARDDLPQASPIDARWLLTRAPLLVGISLAGAAGQRLVAADGNVGRGAWSLALSLFFLGVLLDRSAARGQADRGRRIAYVAASIAAVAPALTLAFRGLPAPPWALSIAALAVIGLWVTRRELLPRWVKRRILNAEAAARAPRTGPDSAALVETLTHTGSGLLLRDDPEYRAVVGRPW